MVAGAGVDASGRQIIQPRPKILRDVEVGQSELFSCHYRFAIGTSDRQTPLTILRALSVLGTG